MNRLVQICIAIIGVPFLIVGWSYLFATKKVLPPGEPGSCVFQIIQSGEEKISFQGIGSYRKDASWLTAYHVVQHCSNDCFVKDLISGKTALLQQIQGLGTSDIALFQAAGMTSHCIVPDSGAHLLTVEGMKQVVLPVVLDQSQLNVSVDYGQSGSPVVKNGITVGVVSRKLESGTYVELLP